MGAKSISAAEAVKAFARQSITVQTAERITIKDKDTGKTRPGFKTADAPLSAALVLAASRGEDGTVTIVTVDGCKHSAAGRAAESAAA